MVRSQEVIFSKIQEIAHRASSMEAAYSDHSIAIHSITMAGYVTTVPALVCGELPAREVSTFCDFKKITSYDFTAFSPLFDSSSK